MVLESVEWTVYNSRMNKVDPRYIKVTWASESNNLPTPTSVTYKTGNLSELIYVPSLILVCQLANASLSADEIIGLVCFSFFRLLQISKNVGISNKERQRNEFNDVYSDIFGTFLAVAAGFFLEFKLKCRSSKRCGWICE